MGPKRFLVLVKWAEYGNYLFGSTGSHWFKDSKSLTKFLSSSKKQVAMDKTSLILLGVKLYQYSQSAVACFKADPILKNVWTWS